MSITIIPNIIETDISLVKSEQRNVKISLAPHEYSGPTELPKVILAKVKKLVGLNTIIGHILEIDRVVGYSEARILSNDVQCRMLYTVTILCKVINIGIGDIIPMCFFEARKEGIAIFNKKIIDIMVEDKHVVNAKIGEYFNIQCLSNISSLSKNKIIIYGKILRDYYVPKMLTHTMIPRKDYEIGSIPRDFWTKYDHSPIFIPSEDIAGKMVDAIDTVNISKMAIINDLSLTITNQILVGSAPAISLYYTKDAKPNTSGTKLPDNVKSFAPGINVSENIARYLFVICNTTGANLREMIVIGTMFLTNGGSFMLYNCQMTMDSVISIAYFSRYFNSITVDMAGRVIFRELIGNPVDTFIVEYLEKMDKIPNNVDLFANNIKLMSATVASMLQVSAKLKNYSVKLSK